MKISISPYSVMRKVKHSVLVLLETDGWIFTCTGYQSCDYFDLSSSLSQFLLPCFFWKEGIEEKRERGSWEK